MAVMWTQTQLHWAKEKMFWALTEEKILSWSEEFRFLQFTLMK